MDQATAKLLNDGFDRLEKSLDKQLSSVGRSIDLVRSDIRATNESTQKNSLAVATLCERVDHVKKEVSDLDTDLTTHGVEHKKEEKSLLKKVAIFSGIISGAVAGAVKIAGLFPGKG